MAVGTDGAYRVEAAASQLELVGGLGGDGAADETSMIKPQSVDEGGTQATLPPCCHWCGRGCAVGHGRRTLLTRALAKCRHKLGAMRNNGRWDGGGGGSDYHEGMGSNTHPVI